MNYYKIAIKGLYLKPLIFQSEREIAPLSEVVVALRAGKKRKAIVLERVPMPPFPTQNIQEITPLSLSPSQHILAQFIAHYHSTKLAFVLSLFEGAMTYDCEALEALTPPTLSPKQLEALAHIRAQQSSLLFADTGSGKTEIYIALMQEYLKEGRQVLLLMPEISLTPQMQRRLEFYFGERVFLWHSQISKKKKAACLEAFNAGKALLIAGARSALFLPFRNLGLIVVDEEHDSSYKATNKPYFNAKDLALFLAHKQGIKIVLGSATPSLTSFYKQNSFRLKGTFFESKKHFFYDESEPALTPLVLSELERSLRAKKQAIVFLPTRANFRQILCKSCGATIQCPFCSVAMSLHRAKKMLRCHYCNFAKAVDESCPACKGVLLEAKKMGTAELCERLQNALPSALIAQFDRDSITSFKKLNTILKDFNDGKINILVGTSMLAKGHDYHSVNLSVILGLDEYLFRPNFRAAEETLALALQVAGRAGRMGEARVLLQTKNRAFFEKYLGDYDGFLRDELERREGLYPPFKRLLRLVIEDENQSDAKALCENLAQKFQSLKGIELVGFGACGIEKLASKWRFHILLRSPSHHALIHAQSYASQFEQVSADMDPIDFA
ncbi:primosomal protein N' [Campylobacter sp.]|uniref:primosomal protein N' n=1 Tax=Campylobacter sp. TaxID=205 RepID=UPI0026DDB1AA|nr:primosomal protein N' [Campylobacter sp.]MDO4674943.1 primosomal protein N' [Campylobacter sp.]